MRFYFLVLLTFFLIPFSAYSNWKEVNCDDISKRVNVLNSNYKPTFCQKYNDSEAIGYIAESFDGTIFMNSGGIQVTNKPNFFSIKLDNEL